MRIINGFAAVAVLVSGVSVPAFAETKAGTPAPVASAPVVPVAKDKRYCVVDTFTGSRIPHKVCKTRAQWLEQGFDPLNPGK